MKVEVPRFTFDAFTSPFTMYGRCLPVCTHALDSTLPGGGWSELEGKGEGGYTAAFVTLLYGIDPFSNPGQAWIVKPVVCVCVLPFFFMC